MTTTRDIDAAAFIAARTGLSPKTLRDVDGQGIFIFGDDQVIRDALLDFTNPGKAQIDACTLLAARRRLFHAVRELRQGGGR